MASGVISVENTLTELYSGNLESGASYSITTDGYKGLYIIVADNYMYTLYVPTSILSTSWRSFWTTSFFQNASSNESIAIGLMKNAIRFGFYAKNGQTITSPIPNVKVYGIK